MRGAGCIVVEMRGPNQGFQFGDPAKGRLLCVFSATAMSSSALSLSSRQTQAARSPRTTLPASLLRSNRFQSSSGRFFHMYSEPKLGSPANIFWIALTTIGVLAWCFGPQTWDWYQAKKMGEAQPCLRLGVQPMVVGDADVAPGTKETFFGYQFEVPWLSVEAKVFRQEATLISPHGSGILFWNPAEA